VLFALLFAVYLFGLSRTGVLGPDEPRYAAIGFRMAASGDFVTPVLWGKPWFEKPPLLYWMTAAAARAGFGLELAPRIPVALTGWAFLVFLWWIARREVGGEAALYAACMLGTSALWIAYSFVAVTDIPLSATFCAAMLIALYRRGTRWACAAGVLLGLAVLAKGLVPLVLFFPLLWPLRRRFRELSLIGLCCLIVAAPWYIAMTVRFGNPFLADFFWKQHFQRFATGALAHVRPWWFYIPVLLGGIFPWTPAYFVIRHDPRVRFLSFWLIFAFVFFSASQNKLPGYMLPLLPPLCLLLGVALERAAKPAKWVLTVSAFLAGTLPAVAAVVPEALRQGLTHTHFSPPCWTLVVALVVAILALLMRNRLFAVTALACAALLYIKVTLMPELDRSVSARPAWYETKPSCVPVNADRDMEYGLEYYANRELPRCTESSILYRE
jgi:4-amino-4-deoxy-L-arabinose transferase-like glycosyltransferase